MLLNILLPLVAVLALGYSSVRTNFLAATHIQALSQFVMKVSLPAFYCMPWPVKIWLKSGIRVILLVMDWAR